MGIYDRPYYQDDARSSGWSARTVVANLILLNLAIFVADVGFLDHRLSDWMALRSDLPSHAWRLWELITYGFAHSPQNLFHILFNMFGLWFFGRELEEIYGGRPFLMAYLTMILGGALLWLIAALAMRGNELQTVVGASGGVMGLVILYACHFPQRQVLVWGVFPVPVWALAATFFAMDLLGMVGHAEASQVAYSAHVGGALIGYLFYRTRWSIDRVLPSTHWWRRMKGPKLKIRAPQYDDDNEDLAARVDAILEKISREGEASLSSRERKVLEDASRRYQRRRQ